jgi:hypothetical protein
MGGGEEGKPLTLGGYLKELEEKKDGKPEQVRDGIEIYVALWKKAIEKGIVDSSDELEIALGKLDGAGGLYAAAGD